MFRYWKRCALVGGGGILCYLISLRPADPVPVLPQVEQVLVTQVEPVQESIESLARTMDSFHALGNLSWIVVSKDTLETPTQQFLASKWIGPTLYETIPARDWHAIGKMTNSYTDKTGIFNRYKSGQLLRHPALARYEYAWIIDPGSNLSDLHTHPSVTAHMATLNQRIAITGLVDGNSMASHQDAWDRLAWATRHYFASPHLRPIGTRDGIRLIRHPLRCVAKPAYYIVQLDLARSPIFSDFYLYCLQHPSLRSIAWDNAVFVTLAAFHLYEPRSIRLLNDGPGIHKGYCDSVFLNVLATQKPMEKFTSF